MFRDITTVSPVPKSTKWRVIYHTTPVADLIRAFREHGREFGMNSLHSWLQDERFKKHLIVNTIIVAVIVIAVILLLVLCRKDF